jgi:isopentenyl-diphosphate delta-isomerase
MYNFNEVVLVNNLNEELGVMEKMKAHELGLMHRAISVFIFNSKGELLLQQRAYEKYHSGGLWTNTCCSHPAQNESMKDAAQRRLQEEMGMDTALIEVFNFTYQASFENGLIENEYDFVFVGYDDTLPVLNPKEACNYQYMSLEMLQDEMIKNPENYTEWFKIIFPKIISYKNITKKQ